MSAESRLSVWSNDSAIDEPAAEERGASFWVEPEPGWQGASLGTDHTFAAGESTWIGWYAVDGLASRAMSGTTVQYRWTEAADPTSWRGPYSAAVKFRLLYCD